MRQFTALLKAEFIDHKGGMLWLPAIIGGLLVLLVAIVTVQGLSGDANIRIDADGVRMMSIDDVKAHVQKDVLPAKKSAQALETVGIVATLFSAAPLLLFAGFATYFMLPSALHSERADRSILFWKSMPVSDTKTVLAKLVGNTIMPFIIALGVAFIVYILVLAMGTMLAAKVGMDNLISLWSPRTLFSVAFAMISFCLCYVLWAAPLYAWILLASAAAPRSPLMVAFLPPVVLGVIEAMFLRSSFLFEELGRRISGFYVGLNEVFTDDKMDKMPSPDFMIANILKAPAALFENLLHPGLFIGLAVSALFLYGAIEIRRRKAL